MRCGASHQVESLNYMGIENKQGRLVVFIARNSDLGDAWEWINDRGIR